MLRALVLAILVAACGPMARTPAPTRTGATLEYPVDRLPVDVRAHMGPGPAPEDYEAVFALIEGSSEAEMVRLRRPMTPFVVKVDNLPEDELVWTVMSFQVAPDADQHRNWFDDRWIARRVRKLWDGRTIVDWADSAQCDGFNSQLAHIVELRPPAIETPDREDRKPDGEKTTIVLDREFTLWTTWAPRYDLRFGGAADSALGQWVIRIAIALRPCWTSTEPHRP